MKKITLLIFSFLMGVCSLSSMAQEAQIAHIEPNLWKVYWEECSFINPLNAVLTDEEEYLPNLVPENGGETTYLYYKKEVLFPESGNYFTINLESVNLPDGVYILTIPEGYVQLPGIKLNEEQQFYLTVGEEIELDHTPNFSEIDGNTFNISWENVAILAPGDTTGAYIINTSTEEKYEMVFLKDDFFSTGNLRILGEFLKVNFTANYPDLPNGIYKFYLPEGYVLFNGGNTGNEAIEGFEFSYLAPWSEGKVVVNGPSDEGMITVTWSEASEVYYNEEYKGDGFGTIGVAIYDGSDSKVEVGYPQNISFEKNTMTIDLNGLNLVSGQCQLVVPEDYVYVVINGETGLSQGVIKRFEYTNPDAPENPENPDDEYQEYEGTATWSIKDGAVIEAGSQPVSLSWSNYELAPVEDPEDAISVFGEESGYRELAFGTEVTISADKTQLLIDLGSLPADTYRINVPANYVYISVEDDIFVNAYTSLENITVTDEEESGVSGVKENDSLLKVYDLNGRKIMEAKNPSQLRNLKGYYIINGKKVVK